MTQADHTSVYLFGTEKIWRVGIFKIGIASDVQKRLKGIQTSCPYPIHVVHAFIFPKRDIARSVESELHDLYAKRRTYGEWYHGEPAQAFYVMTLAIEAIVDMRMPNHPDIECAKAACGIADAHAKLRKLADDRRIDLHEIAP